MQKTANDWWPARVIPVCGAGVGILLFGFILAGVVVEAPQIWQKGAAAFLADAGLRLGFGALVAIVSTTPYVLLTRAARQLGTSTFFAGVAALAFAVQISLTTKALFFGRTSTASIGIFFIPMYLCVAVVAIWGMASLMRRIQLGRTAG